MNWKALFPQFEPALLSLLEKEAVLKDFKAGEPIMRTGQFIKSTALVLEGRIKIYREGPEGITARAEEDTQILLLPVQLMDTLMKEYKSWYQFVIQTYRSRFDELLAVVDDVAFRNMDERLELYLKRYQEKTGKKLIELSHQQIAEDLNSSREVISRLLKKMEQRGLLKLNRNKIELNA